MRVNLKHVISGREEEGRRGRGREERERAEMYDEKGVGKEYQRNLIRIMTVSGK
jgi:hypothetical protein